MKKRLGIVVLGLLLAGCYAPGVREAQRTNPYMGVKEFGVELKDMKRLA